MSFLAFPPEVNSTLMFSGAGGGPMLAAAASWDGLADALDSAARSFSSVTAGLAGQAWQGPASAAMLDTAARYTGFLTAAQVRAQTTATQARAIVGAFEAARAATVHPVVVAVNRNQFVALVVSNLLGQNAPAIAAAEAEYERMWAADAAAMVGYHGAASAAAAQVSAWPTTLQGLSTRVAGAAATVNPVAGLLTTPAQTIGTDLGQAERAVLNVINAPTELLLGRPLIGNGTNGAAGTGQPGQAGGLLWGDGGTGGSGADGHPGGAGGAGGLIGNGGTGGTGGAGSYGGPGGQAGLLFGSPGTSGANGYGVTNGQVPLKIYGGIEPIVYASVNGGPSVPLLVDTGSTGMVLPLRYVGLWNLGLPTGAGISGYSGGLGYLYLTFHAPMDFGGGITTSPTSINVPILSWPTTLSFPQTFSQFFAPNGVVGVMGIGPNALGPGPENPTMALPGSLNQGVLINETDPLNAYLDFGPPPTTGFTPVATLSGSPITTLQVSVNGGPLQSVPSIIDSGGVQGTIPSSVIGNATPGTTVSVYAPSATPGGAPTGLYTYTYYGGPESTSAYYPTVISDGLMNTGAAPFWAYPVYISNSPGGVGTTTFYSMT